MNKQSAAQAKYDKKNTVQFKLKYNKKTDADIIEMLQQCGNKQGLIRELLRAEIDRRANCAKTQEKA